MRSTESCRWAHANSHAGCYRVLHMLLHKNNVDFCSRVIAFSKRDRCSIGLLLQEQRKQERILQREAAEKAREEEAKRREKEAKQREKEAKRRQKEAHKEALQREKVRGMAG